MVHRAMISNNRAGIALGLVRLDISWLPSQSADRSTQVRPTTTVRAVPAVRKPPLCGACGECAIYGRVCLSSSQIQAVARSTWRFGSRRVVAAALPRAIEAQRDDRSQSQMLVRSGQFLGATNLPSCQPRARNRFPLPKQCRRSTRSNSARARDSQRHSSLAWDSLPVLRTSNLQTIPRNRSCIRSGS